MSKTSLTTKALMLLKKNALAAAEAAIHSSVARKLLPRHGKCWLPRTDILSGVVRRPDNLVGVHAQQTEGGGSEEEGWTSGSFTWRAIFSRPSLRAPTHGDARLLRSLSYDEETGQTLDGAIASISKAWVAHKHATQLVDTAEKLVRMEESATLDEPTAEKLIQVLENELERKKFVQRVLSGDKSLRTRNAPPRATSFCELTYRSHSDVSCVLVTLAVKLLKALCPKDDEEGTRLLLQLMQDHPVFRRFALPDVSANEREYKLFAAHPVVSLIGKVVESLGQKDQTLRVQIVSLLTGYSKHWVMRLCPSVSDTTWTDAAVHADTTGVGLREKFRSAITRRRLRGSREDYLLDWIERKENTQYNLMNKRGSNDGFKKYRRDALKEGFPSYSRSFFHKRNDPPPLPVGVWTSPDFPLIYNQRVLVLWDLDQSARQLSSHMYIWRNSIQELVQRHFNVGRCVFVGAINKRVVNRRYWHGVLNEHSHLGSSSHGAFWQKWHFQLVVVPQTEQAVDEKLIEIGSAAISCCTPPAGIVLITGDYDFLPLLRKAKKCNVRSMVLTRTRSERTELELSRWQTESDMHFAVHKDTGQPWNRGQADGKE